jgi:hypothetical protein
MHAITPKHYKLKVEMEENMVTLSAPKFMNIYDCDCYQSYLQLLPYHHHHHHHHHDILKYYEGTAQDLSPAWMAWLQLRFNALYTFTVTSSKQ